MQYVHSYSSNGSNSEGSSSILTLSSSLFHAHPL
jgi:hypothetical protein